MIDARRTSDLCAEQQDQSATDLSGVAQTGNEDNEKLSLTDQQPELMADLPAAIEQLKVWAQIGKVIRYDSGTLLNSVNFMARLLADVGDSFIVHGASEYGAAGLGGCISPAYAEYVRVSREDERLAVILRRLDGSSCIVFDDGGRLEKLLRAQPATPLTN